MDLLGLNVNLSTKPKSTATVDSLPDPLWHEVLYFVPVTQYVGFALVCRRFGQVLRSEQLYQWLLVKCGLARHVLSLAETGSTECKALEQFIIFPTSGPNWKEAFKCFRRYLVPHYVELRKRSALSAYIAPAHPLETAGLLADLVSFSKIPQTEDYFKVMLASSIFGFFSGIVRGQS
jgi:hypothetical protein